MLVYFGGALFGCFGPGAQHDVWKSSVTDFVGMGSLYEQPRQHDQARSSHALKLLPCAPNKEDMLKLEAGYLPG